MQIGNILGGGGGSDFKAQSAPIIQAATKEQADEQYKNAQLALQKQQEFLNAVNAANGIGNQSNVFNQQQGIVNGTGPNPAQAMLNNTTGANVANQAAMMASQRGSGQNAGMIAREAAMQGANTQQQAAGQGAALQAQQSQNALNNMGNIANNQANNQLNAQNAFTGANLNEQNNILNGINGTNNANVANTSNMNNVNGAMAQQTAKAQQNLMGNVFGAVGAAGQLLPGGSWGKFIGGMGGGGAASGELAGGFGDAMGAGAAEAAPLMLAAKGGAIESPKGPRSSYGKRLMAKGGQVPVMLSPGEKALSPQDVAKVAQGKENPMAAGKTVPGKAVVGGAKNSYDNDVVPAKLEEGSIVLPRSVTQSKDAGKKAAAFVEAVLAKKSKKK